MSSIFNRSLASITALMLIFTIISMTPGILPVPKAHAGFLSGLFGGGLGINQSTETTQLMNNGELVANVAATTAVAGNTTALLTKESTDGIAWAIAKQMVSNMTKSMVNWINSGFQGKPAFITDLKGMLLDTLDTTAGEYIKSLGGIGEFICSPFKLDVQAALAINYQQARSGMPSGPTACKLTDMGNNIDNFMDGNMTDWGQWLQITSNPQNTPYGAYLEAEVKLNAALRNAAGEELTISTWNNGFLSKKICEGINGQPSEKGVNCKITTPGVVISDAINYQLHTGTDSLIQADEINEVIGALINQLTLQAMQGANGLLGLGGNSSYTDYSYGNGGNTQSYIDAAAAEQDQLIDTSSIRTQMGSALEIETNYNNLASTALLSALTKLGPFTLSPKISALLDNSAVTSIGITPGNTLVQAETKLEAAYATSSVDLTELDRIKVQLALIRTATTQLEASNLDLTNLDTVSLSMLKTDGTAAQKRLTNLVSESTRARDQASKNIVLLNKLIVSYDNASSSATVNTTANTIRQNTALDYLALVQAGLLTNKIMVDTKRLEWQTIIGPM